MRVMKPFKVGFLHKMFCAQSKYYFGVEVLLFTDFEGGRLASDIAMWKMIGEELPGMTIDDPVSKARGEFLVRGHAFPPGGHPAATCPVAAKVGDIEKRLSVIGDRYWRDDDVPTAPTPFTSMPLTWDRAFGGEGFLLNPSGRGVAPVAAEDGTMVHPLPNIEPWGRLLTKKKDRPNPAGFMPIGFESPIRMAKAGTYDEKWKNERFPGYPDDLDWSIFNTALEDQWAASAWTPDTKFSFLHMHPSEATVEGRLPNYVGRAFVVMGKTPQVGQRWQEVPLQLSTLWFFPHIKKVIIGFMGAVQVAEDNGSDVDYVVVAAEHAGRPKSHRYYEELMQERQGYDLDAVAAAMRDSDLLPEGIPSDIDEVLETAGDVTPKEHRRRAAMLGAMEDWEAARARCVAQGLDPDEYLGPCPFTEEDLAEPKKMSIDEALASALEAKAKGEEAEATALAEQKKRVADLNERAAEMGVDVNEWMQDAEKELPVGAPIQWAEKVLAHFNHLTKELRRIGAPDLKLEAQIEDPEFIGQFLALERQQVEAYRATAHVSSTRAGMPKDPHLVALRAHIEAELAGEKKFDGLDLTGADFTDLDLTGASFREAFLEHARFDRAVCVDVNFKKAVLARTTWNGATWTRVKLRDANLGRADLTGLKIGQYIDLRGAILGSTRFSPQTSLAGARLDGIELDETDLTGVCFDGASITGATFRKCTFERASFIGANLKKTDFEESDIRGVSFESAILDGASFHMSKVDGASFKSARCNALHATMGCTFERCNFELADLRAAYFRDSAMAGSRFGGATLDTADLCNCDLRGAVFDGARGRGARLSRAKLDGASFERADFMYTMFDNASVPGTSFAGANLFTTDFGMVRSNDQTNVSGANQKRVKVVPLRPPDPEVPS